MLSYFRSLPHTQNFFDFDTTLHNITKEEDFINNSAPSAIENFSEYT